MEMAHTPDGRLLATDSEGDIKIWDVASGRIVQRFASAGRRTEMHLSRSGELFYVRGSIYDLRTGPGPATSDLASWADQFTEGNSANYEFFAGFILSKETSICYSPNLGTRPQLWEESREPKLLHLGDSLMFAGDRDFATASFLPSGAWTHYCPLECFDWTSVELKRRPKHKRPWLMQPVKSAHTEVMLLPYPDGFLFLIDLADGGIRPINSLDYLAAMDVTVGEKMSERYIESRWELQEREKNERWPLKKGEAFSPEKKVPQFYINAAVISDDGQWILTATHWDAVRIWDVTTGRCVRAFTLPPAACHFAGHVEAISLTPDGGGCYLALQDGTTHLLECWQKDIGAWRMILRLEGPTEVYCSLLQNRRFAFRQTNSRDTLEIHDLLTSAVISLAPLSRRFGDMKYYDNNLLVTPDDLHMVMAHGETLVVFTLEGLQEITRYPLPAKVKSLSTMTRDGRFVVHTEAGDLLRLKLHLPEG